MPSIKSTKKQSSKFKSHYAFGKEITAAQYITELICERRAESLNTNLPQQFWNLPEWKAYYFYQLKLAYQILQKYKVEDVLQVLRQLDKCYSLKNKILIQKLETTKHIEVKGTVRRITEAQRFEIKKENSLWEKLDG